MERPCSAQRFPGQAIGGRADLVDLFADGVLHDRTIVEATLAAVRGAARDI